MFLPEARESPPGLFQPLELHPLLGSWWHHSKLCFCCHSSVGSDTPASPSRDACDCDGPAWVRQDALSISSSLPNRCPLPREAACSQVPGMRMRTPWGPTVQPPTVGFPLFSGSPPPRQSTPSPSSCHSKTFFTPCSSKHPPIRSLSPDALKSRLRWKILTLYAYRTEFNK